MTLSEKTKATVKATIPVLEENGVALTDHFYRRMFKHNPEVKPYFNPSNQDGGQQSALAGAIVAYARNIDQPAALKDAVVRISQKHASLMVQPEHYPIVGENLLASISEVLGEAATDDIITAWAEAYGFLADILINAEQSIYTEQSQNPGGWRGFRRFKIDRKIEESAEVISFYLTPVDKAPLPSFSAGQFITIRLPHDDTVSTMRNYSLSSPKNADGLRISVKRESADGALAAGYVSNKLHADYNVGDEVEVGPPCGAFTLDEQLDNDRPLVFLAGGIGVTPLLAMAQTALAHAPDRAVSFIHACRTPEAQPFAEEITALAASHPSMKALFLYDQSEPPMTEDPIKKQPGRITKDILDQIAPGLQPVYYFCGPGPFMEALMELLPEQGVPAGDMRYEYFGPES